MSTTALTEVPSSAPAADGRRHDVVLSLDPLTHAELRRAAGGQSVQCYLRVLAGRHARWLETREWLLQLEAAYGKMPPEALEALHRRMLGLPRAVPEGARSLTITLDAEEAAALAERAGEQPLAPYARDVLIDHLTGGTGPGAAEAAGPE
ncbi:hypothetical protein [Marinitenerispora sediminis]|uniref:Uncharacterized protein n=1 Tax=Marinitenerispora sediminis TaxID=1931232 RepID=A0A368T712_9ACTN|nr:hypothetical protein [Marinitenerispora sediminis]RCV54647.1 hypothetical protein DEF23_15535 [Marinitenerispora sediminis]RCV56403.1 hypothetical protein DEF28_03610 [Marinitenerispora sediminis]RCV59747.1 hypothetical protein DEF24_08935 [Marinitenerispora sediminis]